MEQQLTDQETLAAVDTNDRPFIATVFYAFAGIFLLIGFAFGIAFMDDYKRHFDELEFGMMIGGIGYGAFNFAVAFVLHKLSQIEGHLRARR